MESSGEGPVRGGGTSAVDCGGEEAPCVAALFGGCSPGRPPGTDRRTGADDAALVAESTGVAVAGAGDGSTAVAGGIAGTSCAATTAGATPMGEEAGTPSGDAAAAAAGAVPGRVRALTSTAATTPIATTTPSEPTMAMAAVLRPLDAPVVLPSAPRVPGLKSPAEAASVSSRMGADAAPAGSWSVAEIRSTLARECGGAYGASARANSATLP